jgi:hypothetical protein
MGQATAEKVSEIDQTRKRLETELRELETYLPAAALWAKRAVGAIVAGGMMTSILVFTIRRKRRRDAGSRLRDLEHRLDRVEREVGRPHAYR